MAITPKKIFSSAVAVGRTVASAPVGLVGRLRGKQSTPAPSTPGTPAYESEPEATTSPAVDATPSGRAAGKRAAGTKSGRATPGTTRTARAKSSAPKRPTGAAAAKRGTSGSPATVGAPKPGEPGGHKSASAAKPKSPAKPPAGTTEPPPAKPPARDEP